MAFETTIVCQDLLKHGHGVSSVFPRLSLMVRRAGGAIRGLFGEVDSGVVSGLAWACGRFRVAVYLVGTCAAARIHQGQKGF